MCKLETHELEYIVYDFVLDFVCIYIVHDLSTFLSMWRSNICIIFT